MHALSNNHAFAAGLMLGLGVGLVALVLVEARRHTRVRVSSSSHHLIDGIGPLDGASLGARPSREGNAIPRRLESDAFDAPIESQRW